MKPESWRGLPSRLVEVLLWDIDLDYCPYESSKAECIYDFSNGIQSSINVGMLNAYWKALSDSTFDQLVKNERESALSYYNQLGALI